MGKRLTTILLAILLLTQPVQAASLRINFSGGAVSTRSMSIWQLHRYKYTTLLRRKPLIWCPYKSYTLVDRYVSVYDQNNSNWISVDTDILKQVSVDSRYNRAYARSFPFAPTKRKQVRKIYNYCRRTKYVAHTKYARDVFTTRRGDCAAISAAFYVLCQAKHIPVRYVIGWTKSDCHAWNRVKLDGKWYWIDCTLGKYLSRKQFPHRTIMEMW